VALHPPSPPPPQRKKPTLPPPIPAPPTHPPPATPPPPPPLVCVSITEDGIPAAANIEPPSDKDACSVASGRRRVSSGEKDFLDRYSDFIW